MIRQCTGCRQDKPLSDFSLNARSRTLLRKRCNDRYSLTAARWAKANPDRMRAAVLRRRASGADRAARLRDRFGITQEDYSRMLLEQGGHCALCPSEVGSRQASPLHVDHDHTTGALRGLLCSNCNRGLGYFGDDASRLMKAAAYLAGKMIPENADQSLGDAS